MTRRRNFASCLLAFLLTASAAYPQSQPELSDAANTMAAMVAEFRDGATLAEWRKSHPNDSVGTFAIRAVDIHTGADTDWCAHASKTVRLADGRAIQRTAYFFVPERRGSEPLPAQDNNSDLINSCTLGHLWIETTEPNIETGTALAHALRSALQERLGAPDPKSEVSFLGSAAWFDKGKWRSGNTMVASAYDRTLGNGRKRVLAVVTTPMGDKYGFNAGPIKGLDDDYDPIRELLRQVELSAGFEPQAAAIERFLDSTNPNRPGAAQDPCGNGAELAAVLTRWMELAKQWQGERHAAALLAADLTTAASENCFQSKEESTRAQLKAMGADFQYSELGGGWVYTRSWLREVAQKQPAGRIGEMAFLEWMRTGFREGCCCIGESPERVVEKGEQYLKQKRAPNTEAEVHFMLGDAYRDIVALAGGAGQEYGDPETYRPRAPRARQQAIAHFRAGLKLDSHSDTAQQAWRSAWRLIAGLTTAETRYFCVYD